MRVERSRNKVYLNKFDMIQAIKLLLEEKGVLVPPYDGNVEIDFGKLARVTLEIREVEKL